MTEDEWERRLDELLKLFMADVLSQVGCATTLGKVLHTLVPLSQRVMHLTRENMLVNENQ